MWQYPPQSALVAVDLKCDPGASLVVIGTGCHPAGGWFGDATERLVRHCTLPMLFAPTRGWCSAASFFQWSKL